MSRDRRPAREPEVDEVPTIVFDPATGHDAVWSAEDGCWYERITDPQDPTQRVRVAWHLSPWELPVDLPQYGLPPELCRADQEPTAPEIQPTIEDWSCPSCSARTRGTAEDIARFIVAHDCPGDRHPGRGLRAVPNTGSP